jgi:predicted MFS family arabinose efflux permease
MAFERTACDAPSHEGQSWISIVHDVRTRDASKQLIVPLVVLACGHMLSNLVRTLPAVAVDVMAPDLGSSAQELAGLTAAYHFAFAICQLPIGAALDRFSVRAVSLTLLAGSAAGAAFAALSTGPWSFLLAQLMLGMATSGMLMCPMTLAARQLTPMKFGLWSGVILSLGNMGMLLSASPLAWVVEGYGWRAGFWISFAVAFVIAAMVAVHVPNSKPRQSKPAALAHEMIDVVRLATGASLRGIVALAFVSLAVALVLRGLWGGPWLMEVKGLSRLDAGNVLLVFTLAMIAGPFLIGVADRKFGHRRILVAGAHLAAALVLFLMAAGGPGGIVSSAFGARQMPARYDVGLLILFGLLVSAQPLIYALTRQAVAVEVTGKALSAVNLAFFLGTAVMQSATGPIAAGWGLAVVLAFMGACLIAGVAIFIWLARPERVQAHPTD